MKNAIDRRTNALFIVVAIVPVLLASLSFWLDREHIRFNDRVLRTQAVLSDVDHILTAITEAESAQRGYLLTGRETYLQPFVAAVQRSRALNRELLRLTSHNPVQQKILRQFGQVLDSKIEELQKTIRLRRTSGATAALDVVDTDAGLVWTEQLGTLGAQMRTEEERLLKLRRSDADHAAFWSLTVEIALVLATILLLIAASMIVHRSNREREARQSELEARVAARTAELEQTNRDLEAFAYTASHDLQEPLRMVSSFVTLLARKYEHQSDADARSWFRFALQGTTRMHTLVEDLLTYSRTGRQAVIIEPVSLNDVIRVISDDLQFAIQDSGTVIRSSDLPVVNADRIKIRLLLQNLIANAIKFRREGVSPEIGVSVERVGNFWQISVTDNGIGFQTADVERIFQIFQRLHSTEKYPGNGIGLAICKRIVEAHGGTLTAESRAGVGSTFTFTLPVRTAISVAQVA